ncbi:hypothetical protein HELRODRAFT_191412 [Helobdella robusta]|uniref:Uncharacterized protein n=1 Tax=Helobdella robusta TaxID=6412 RepID=T1FSY7_HELRO|nr:hypothetical protein HELRODRAFT_191412 [Helobdella robusta]ESO05216.1 hypothetical protein HELRODRAFT_191412 [Helobdella robusta]
MADYMLATAGEQVKFWTVENCDVVNTWKPYVGGVPALAWAPNNNFIACLSSSSNEIKVKYTVPDMAASDVTTIPTETTGKQCLTIDSSSRLILAGGSNGLLHLWDIKSQKLRKTYKHASCKSMVTSCQYNLDDCLIAASHENGDVIFYNATSSVATGPISANNKSAIRCLRFSYFCSNLLATVSDDGATRLWDATTRTHQHTYKNTHGAPATSLAFSPFNQLLMLTAGLDKKVVCYDVISKKSLKSVSVDTPLTSIDIFPDGITVAVGTTRGQIIFYDLRKGFSQFMKKTAHTTSVHCLTFQKKAPSSQTKSVQETKLKSVKESSNVIVRNVSPEKLKDMTNLNDSPLQKVPSNKVESAAENLFSPHRDHDSFLANHTPDHLNISKCTMDRGDRDSLQMFESYNRLSDINNVIFSPIVSDPNNHSSTNHSFTPSDVKMPPLSLDTSEMDLLRMSLNASFVKDISSSSQMQIQFNNIGAQAMEKIISSPVQQTSSLPTQMSSSLKTSTLQNLDISSIGDKIIPQNIGDKCLKDANSVDSTKSKTALSVANEKLKVRFNDSTVNYSLDSSVGNETAAIPVAYLQGGSFPVEFIRNVIRDEMEEYFEQMRDCVVKLQAEMIKKFYHQQIEMEKLLKSYSVNPDLISEINRLKEENENLKRNYTFSQLNK